MKRLILLTLATLAFISPNAKAAPGNWVGVYEFDGVQITRTSTHIQFKLKDKDEETPGSIITGGESLSWKVLGVNPRNWVISVHMDQTQFKKELLKVYGAFKKVTITPLKTPVPIVKKTVSAAKRLAGNWEGIYDLGEAKITRTPTQIQFFMKADEDDPEDTDRTITGGKSLNWKVLTFMPCGFDLSVDMSQAEFLKEVSRSGTFKKATIKALKNPAPAVKKSTPAAKKQAAPAVKKQTTRTAKKAAIAKKKQPVRTAKRPQVSKKRRVASAKRPVALTKRPVASTKRRIASTKRPVASTKRRIASTKRPVASTKRRVASAKRTVASKKKTRK